jgi:hypothetical protein
LKTELHLIAKVKNYKKYPSSTTKSLSRKFKNCQSTPSEPAQECPLSRRNPHAQSPISISSPLCSQDLKSSDLADSDIRSLVDTSLGRTFTESRGLLVVVVGTLVFLADVLDRLGTGLGDSGSVAVVAVDTDEILSVGSLDIVDDDLSSTADLETHVSDFDRGKKW